MEDYVVLSIETHLFFARIMKEHSFFLEAGFPCKEEKWIKRAEWFRQQFEDLLRQVTDIAGGRTDKEILESGELVTEFTLSAEKKTQCLTGIEIDRSLTEAQQRLRKDCGRKTDSGLIRRVRQMNSRAVGLLDGLIEFKERILREVRRGELFTVNYPLLIEHILREAKLYRAILQELMQNRQVCRQSLWEEEKFWNQIMMEHALFIRGLLDPSEEQLIDTADEFADTFRRLLEKARSQDCRASEELTAETLEETKHYREFKTAGTEGILNCSIASIILPLLADHVLREANHYIRILETGRVG